MADTIIHNGDVGTIIRLTITDKDGAPIDVSGATDMKFFFAKPDKEKMNKDAEFNTDGTDGKLKCKLGALDLDQVGRWQVQAWAGFSPTDKYYSLKTTFIVQSNLA